MAMGANIAALWNLNGLLRRWYAKDYDGWLRAGRPHGPFWVPKESRTFLGTPRIGSSIAQWRMGFLWILKDPTWVRGQREDVGRLRRMRMSMGISSVGFIIILVNVLTRNEI